MARTEVPEAITPDWVKWIIEEARRRPEQVRSEAADFGTEAHILIDHIIQGLEPEIPPEMELVVNNFSSWRMNADLDIQLTETMVYSAKYRYAGAMDAIAYRDGKLVALDWKTSNGIYPEYALQVAAYAKALEEMTEEPVTEAWTVRFGKAAPEFEAQRVVDLDNAFIAFRAALYLWRAIRSNLLQPPA
jgi:ATP-dependent exoDNAse (exonuclease V) beta subunit